MSSGHIEIRRQVSLRVTAGAGQGNPVEVGGIVQQGLDKITAPHIVRQIAEEMASVRIIAHVLDDGATVSIAMRILYFFRSRVGKTLQKHSTYVGIPRAVDQGLMSQDGVGQALTRAAEE